ncbi:MAG: hypothetical protein ACTSSP_07315 [Candidatus Asgardarchaeia archaeon]
MVKLTPKDIAQLIMENPQNAANKIKKYLNAMHKRIKDPAERMFLEGLVKSLNGSDRINLLANLNTLVKDDLKVIRKGLRHVEKFAEIDDEVADLQKFLRLYNRLLKHLMEGLPEEREIAKTEFLPEEEYTFTEEEEEEGTSDE